MNQTPINDQLTELLAYIGARAKDADAFVMEHAPALAREVVAWYIVENVIAVGLFGMAVTLCGALSRWSYRWFCRVSATEKDVPFLAVASCFVFAFFCAMGAIVHIKNVIQGCVAPRMVIVDYVESKIGGRR